MLGLLNYSGLVSIMNTHNLIKIGSYLQNRVGRRTEVSLGSKKHIENQPLLPRFQKKKGTKPKYLNQNQIGFVFNIQLQFQSLVQDGGEVVQGFSFFIFSFSLHYFHFLSSFFFILLYGQCCIILFTSKTNKQTQIGFSSWHSWLWIIFMGFIFHISLHLHE